MNSGLLLRHAAVRQRPGMVVLDEAQRVPAAGGSAAGRSMPSNNPAAPSFASSLVGLAAGLSRVVGTHHLLHQRMRTTSPVVELAEADALDVLGRMCVASIMPDALRKAGPPAFGRG